MDAHARAMVALGERAAVVLGCCDLRQSQASRRGIPHRSGSDKSGLKWTRNSIASCGATRNTRMTVRCAHISEGESEISRRVVRGG